MLMVSPISFWEISTLVRMGRIGLDRNLYDWINDVLSTDRVEFLPLSPQAAAAAGGLPGDAFPGDPADRFLYAQAREASVVLITKDRRIRDHARRTGDLRTVW